MYYHVVIIILNSYNSYMLDTVENWFCGIHDDYVHMDDTND